MRSVLSLVVALFILVAPVANAEIEIWKDFKPSEEVYSVGTIKVAANMQEVYLEGLMNTWVPSMEAAKKLGHVKDFAIYFSDLPASGDFNLLLVVTYENSAQMAPNKAKYDAFMAEVTKKKADSQTEYARKNYPNIREINGDYNFRKIEILKK